LIRTGLPAHTSIGAAYRTAFISSEATEALKEWLNIRDKYLKTSIGRSRGRKPTQDGRIFPFHKANAYIVWNNALDKAKFNGKDKATNRHKIHPHVLRKFFRTHMATVIPVDVVEALIGHEGYLTEVYRRYSLEQLAEFYQKGEATLSVFTEMEEVSKLRLEVEERNKALQTLVNGLTRENMELKEKMGTVESQMGTLVVENQGYAEEMAGLRKQFQDLYEVVKKITQEKK